MQRGWVHTRSRPFTLLLGLLAAAFVISIIIYPDQAFLASLKGLKLWWEWVFPALLPFLIVTEMLLGTGVVHGLGVLLEPLMRRVFHLPGAGGWVLAAGLIGGYPLGAEAAARLRKREAIGQADAERLMSLSHLSSPMLMVGVAGAGFLHSPEAGLMLALLHYASAAAADLSGRRLFRRSSGGTKQARSEERLPGSRREGLLVRALRTMNQAHKEDGRTFGKLLGDAVNTSVQALMMIGGLMMIFSVAVRIIDLQTGASHLRGWLFRLLPGVLEPHLGAFAFSQEAGWLPSVQAACIGAALAWSGFSLHAQALSLASGTDIRYGPFFRFRLLHSGFAAVLTLLLWEPLGRLLQGTEAVFSPVQGWEHAPAYSAAWSFRDIAALWGTLLALLALLLAFMLLVSLTIRMLERASERRPS